MYTRYHNIILSVLKKTIVFSGKEDRSAFCGYGLFCLSILFIYGGLVFLLIPSSTDIINIIELPIIRVCCVVLLIALLLPYISLSYRRCSDIGSLLLFWLLIISFVLTVAVSVAMWKIKELQTMASLMIVLLSSFMLLLTMILLAVKKGKGHH